MRYSPAATKGQKTGDSGLADRDLQAARRQSASLSDRRADQARQQLAQQPARRPYALGLGCRTLIGGRDKQNRPVKPFAWWPRLIAYRQSIKHWLRLRLITGLRMVTR